MRGLSRWARHVAPVLAVLLVLAATPVWAAETPTPPTNPPDWRIQPPGGLTAQWRIQPPGGASAQAPAPMPLFDLFLIWLQSRWSIPHG